MADWVTISSLATAGGTLALAGATYASVRSSNRSARIAEVALQEQRRPVLVQSRSDDLGQEVGFVDDRWVSIPGGGAAVEATTDAVYLAMSLRNVGTGLAVLQAWHAHSVEGRRHNRRRRGATVCIFRFGCCWPREGLQNHGRVSATAITGAIQSCP